MDRFEGSDSFAKERGRATVVAIGIFDGVHLGHQELMRRASEEAGRLSAKSVVYTFEPHPVKILSPEQCPLLITTREQKLAQMENQGIDAVIVEPFTQQLSRQSPQEFMSSIVMERLGARAVTIGYDFTFGLHRQGTIETFEELGTVHGVEVVVVPAVFADETLISSTVIRQMISAGEVQRASMLLGRPYEATGSVIPGRGFGMTLAARTANLRLESEIVPKDGVYITRTLVHPDGYDRAGAEAYPSVTSVGDNPTFADNPHSVETHLIDEEVEIKGRRLSIEFISHMHDQVRFTSVDELRSQIHRDIDAAREFHGRAGS